MLTRRSIVVCLAAAAACLPGAAFAEPAYVYRAAGNRLLTLATEAPQAVLSDVAITGIVAGETLVGIDMRPQNGQLYGLGVNATANTATLYAISRRTGVAAVVGSAPSQIAYVIAGVMPVDLPDPAVVGYGFDFNPLADRIRVSAGAFNARVDPNAGTPIDGDPNGTGTNPDGNTNGASSSVDASAYTNNQPNTTVTTLYTLDASSNQLMIQNPPNNGTQVLVAGTIDFTAINGFDIPSRVNAPMSNAGAPGNGFAALTAAGANSLYVLNLTTGAATFAGTIGDGTVPSDGLAVQNIPLGMPIIALSSTGGALVRFSAASPGTTTTVGVTGIVVGETLVGLDFRPQTGQLYALGVDPVANTGTLYRMDPQTGSATVVGAPGQVAFVDAGGTPVDLPDPALADYGFDFNPTVDRLRVTTRSGLNFRVNPNNGVPVDSNANAVGVNPDTGIAGDGSTGVEAAAYTNSFGQNLALPGPTTLYTLDSVRNTLNIQNPANAGTQTAGMTVRLGGATLDFVGAAAFDIPPAVVVATGNAPARGYGYAVLTVGGVAGLYAIRLDSGEAVALGTLLSGVRGLAVADFAETVFANGFE